jgi:Domain of unknown function (DUF4349)
MVSSTFQIKKYKIMRTSVFLCLFIALTFITCKNQNEEQVISSSQMEAAPAEAKSVASNDKSLPSESLANEAALEKNTKIIKDGQVEMEVSDIAPAKSGIDAIVKKYQAYYELDEFSANDYSSTYSLKIRSKADQFDALVNSLLTMGNGAVIKHKNINARDVTMEYIDTESRMKSGKAYVERYKHLLAKAHSIKDILELENIIQQKQAEIESYEGRLKYMNDQIAYSTLSLTLTQKHEYYAEETKIHFGQKLVNAVKQGFDVLLSIVLSLVTIWPIILIVSLVIVFRNRIFWWRRK